MSKKVKKMLLLLILVIVLAVILFQIFKIQNIILKRIYPTKYSEYVYKYAKEYNIDPLLVFAIIKAESNFNPNVISSSKAIGLMQLMDATAEEIARKLNITFQEKSSLYNPELNIQLGVKYFSNLLKEYNNNQLLALTAYNAGIGNVKNWIEQGIIKPDGSDIENIPFKETNNYVRKILRDYKIYKELYK
ncbi:MAG: lytic transglycosylase domain-containing protein [Clostridia bacterium]|jgi:soluble lytic murein transglycosylase|nr:lytic transglycosylase domain-containing protein [Clostridia bacterium]